MINRIIINTKQENSNDGSSSKGNQPKWFIDNLWYKADHIGYEGLCEVVVSKLLNKTNIDNFVKYEPTIITNNGTDLLGCVSSNFKQNNETIFTLERLFRAYNGRSLAKALLDYSDIKDRIKFTVDFIEECTNLKNVGEYLTAMIELDAFFLNEDRHTNNIAFIRDDNTENFKFCPYFDFGLSILSDTKDFPIDSYFYDCINQVKAKPFDVDFDLQLDAAEELYGTQLKIKFTEKDIICIVKEFEGYYDKRIIDRVVETLISRRNKYRYLLR